MWIQGIYFTVHGNCPFTTAQTVLKCKGYYFGCYDDILMDFSLLILCIIKPESPKSQTLINKNMIASHELWFTFLFFKFKAKCWSKYRFSVYFLASHFMQLFQFCYQWSLDILVRPFMCFRMQWSTASSTKLEYLGPHPVTDVVQVWLMCSN